MKTPLMKTVIATLVSMALPALTEAASVSLTAADTINTSSFNSAGKWSNGQAPVSTNDYYTSAYFLRTPVDGGSTTYTFGGNSMTFQQPTSSGVRSLIVKSGNNDTFVINNLTNAFGGILENGGSGNVVSTFTGNFWTIAGNSAVMADQGSLLIGYPLVGASGVILTNGGGNGAGITYNGSNTLFQGIFYLSPVNFGNGGGNTPVILNAPNSQPGNPTSFTPNQFWITAGSTLQDNVGLSFTNSNGGFLINGGGTATFNAGADSMVSEPITDYTNGVSSVCSLTKTGSGILNLGGNNNYSGGTIISAGTLQMGAPGGLTNNSALTDNAMLDLNGVNTTINTLTGSGTVDTVAGGAPTLTIGSAGGTSTFAGTIQNSAGALSLAVVGGAFTLSGNPTYSGNTIVQAATLNLTTAGTVASAPGSLIVSNGGVLNINALSGVALPANNVILSTNGTVNISLSPAANGITASGSLNFQDNATINLAYGTVSGNPTVPAINAAGGISAPGSNVVINISATGFKPGTFTLIKYSGTPPASIANLQLSPPPGVAAVLVNNTGNQSLDMQITSIPNVLAWNGVDGTSWDLVTPNWTNLVTGGITVFQQYTNHGVVAGDSVLFDDTLTNDFVDPQPTNVVLNSTFFAFPVTFNNTVPYTIAGSGGITGVTSLTLSNIGSVTILTSNSYSGGVNVVNGTLIVTNDSALGASSGAVTLSGGTLQMNGGVTNSRSVSVPATSYIGTGPNDTARLNGPVNGTTLNTSGTGTLVLANKDTFSSDLFIHTGTVIIDSGGVVTNNYYDDVGQDTNDSATLTIRGTGSLTTTSDFNVGDLGASAGTLNVTNSGNLTANAFFIGSANASGSTASGVVNQSGGTITEVNSGVGEFCIGGRTSTSGVGVYNMSGGTLTGAAGIRVGSTGIGTLNQSGGLINAVGGINIARIAGSYGTNNLNGGTLSTLNVASSTGTNAVFNFNGGTLQANFSPTASTAFGSSWFTPAPAGTTILTYILAGGAFIDSSNFNVTISVPLLAGSPTSGGLTKKGTGTLNLMGTNTFTGPITNNAGTLILAAPSTYAGSLVVNTGAVQVTSSCIFQGGAVINSNANLAATSSSTLPGGAVINNGGILTINQAGSGDENMGNLTFNGGASGSGGTLAVTPNLANNPAVALVNCSTLTLNGTNTISVPLETVGTIAVIKYSSLAGTGNCTNIALPQGAVGYVTNNTANSTVYAVITSTGPGIYWTGTNSAAGHTNVWDIGTTINWILNTTPTTYHQVVIPGDAVVFSDSGSGTVLVTNNVGPTSIVISNNVKNYTFSGPGNIVGPTGIEMLGSGKATLNLTNTSAGATVISNGTLQAGSTSPVSPTGNLIIGSSGTFELAGFSMTAGDLLGSGVVDNNNGATPTLTIGTSSGGTWNGTIHDTGAGGITVHKVGTGTWVVGGTNNLFDGQSFSDIDEINQGTTILTNGGSLNIAFLQLQIASVAGEAATMVVAGGRLTVTNNVLSVGYGSATATGTLIVNSGTVDHSGLSAGTFAAVANSIDVGAQGSTGTMTVNGGQVLNDEPLYLGDGAGSEGTLNLNGGLVQASQVTANASPASSIANFNGGILQAATNNADFIDLTTEGNIQTGGLILDDGGWDIHLPNGLTPDATLTGGGLTKQGAGQVYLDGANSYTGTTLVNNGLLAGNGFVSGPMVVNPGGNLGAGDEGGVGIFSVQNNLTLQGAAVMRINATGGSLSEDNISVSGNITYGGLLIVTNITSDSTPLTTSDTFQLFSVSGTSSGNFTGIAGSPGSGLAYSFNPASGVLSIITQTIAPNPTNILFSVSGNTLTISWPADHLGWILQSQTNSLSTGLAGNWYDILGSNSNTNSVQTLNPTNPAVFYRLRHP